MYLVIFNYNKVMLPINYRIMILCHITKYK